MAVLMGPPGVLDRSVRHSCGVAYVAVRRHSLQGFVGVEHEEVVQWCSSDGAERREQIRVVPAGCGQPNTRYAWKCVSQR